MSDAYGHYPDPDPDLTSRQTFRLYRPPGWSDDDLGALAVNPMHRPAGWPPADDPIRLFKAQQGKARIYRTPADPEDPEIGPSWHWQCPECRMQSNGCAHAALHGVGTWAAAMCGGIHHVHTVHPRIPATQGEHPHSTLGSRRRCDWSPPSEAHRRLATLVLCGRTGYPRGDRAREMAREVLALAGIRTPG